MLVRMNVGKWETLPASCHVVYQVALWTVAAHNMHHVMCTNSNANWEIVDSL